MFHDTIFGSKSISHDFKSTPFKPYTKEIDLKREDFKKLDFEAYCEFFGFCRSALYTGLENEKLAETARKNIEIALIDYDLIIPFHLFRPTVDKIQKGLDSWASQDQAFADVQVPICDLFGHLELHDSLRLQSNDLLGENKPGITSS